MYRRTKRYLIANKTKYSEYKAEVSKNKVYETKHVFVVERLLNLSCTRNERRKNYLTIKTDL